MTDFIDQNWLLLLLLVLWTLPWKGVALWKAANLRDKTWFVVLLLLNTVGILEIIYIFRIARKKDLLGRAFGGI